MTKNGSGLGWNTFLVVEAYAVTIRDAAGPQEVGLLHPLLKRMQRGAGSLGLFGLPAVQAVINYKVCCLVFPPCVTL